MRINRGLNQAGNDVQQQPDGTKNLYQPIVDLVFHAIIIASIITNGFDKASAALSGAMPIGFWPERLLAESASSITCCGAQNATDERINIFAKMFVRFVVPLLQNAVAKCFKISLVYFIPGETVIL